MSRSNHIINACEFHCGKIACVSITDLHVVLTASSSSMFFLFKLFPLIY